MAVSFGSRVAINPETGRKDKNGVRVTKQGNPYYKTNVGKKVGAGVATFGAVAGGIMMGLMTKNLKVAAGYAALGLAYSLPSGLIGGAIFDAAMNHHEKKKADAMAPYNA